MTSVRETAPSSTVRRPPSPLSDRAFGLGFLGARRPPEDPMTATRYDAQHALGRPRRSISFRDSYLRNREYGFRPKYGDQNRLFSKLYASLRPISAWEHDVASNAVPYPGGIQNLAFSPDGKLLAASCTKTTVLLFDPINQKCIMSIQKGHKKSDHCVKFIDSQKFAVCNNDTIALWDVRNLKDKIRSFKGHHSWINSMEFSLKDNLLISSSFDGNIFTWNINNCTEEDNGPVCKINGLMHIKLLPDSSKLIVSTKNGFILLINNLNLETLGLDLQGFRPNVYRLMQLSKTIIPNAAAYSQVFTRSRNRVEFITDFPDNDNTTIVYPIELHPQGWNVLSRSSTSNLKSEWTCVHDIQENEFLKELIDPEKTSSENLPSSVFGPRRSHRQSALLESKTNVNKGNPIKNFFVPHPHHNNNVRSSYMDQFQDLPYYKIPDNINRLTHYIEETNIGKGYFKQCCYSNDGRIICSPTSNGVRLLSFSPNCEELSTLQPKLPAVELHEVCSNFSHSSVVVSTQFSPVHPLLASGCLTGRIVWYQPRS